jgi:hypothetical protein
MEILLYDAVVYETRQVTPCPTHALIETAETALPSPTTA